MSDKEILIAAAEILYQARMSTEELPDDVDLAVQVLTDEVKDNW